MNVYASLAEYQSVSIVPALQIIQGLAIIIVVGACMFIMAKSTIHLSFRPIFLGVIFLLAGVVILALS